MDLVGKYDMVKINETNDNKGVLIENNLDIDIDNISEDICNIFLVNKIKNVEYKSYNYNKAERKVIIHINNNMNKGKKYRLISIVNQINNLINKNKIKLIRVNLSSNNLSTVFPPLNTIELSPALMKKHDISENENVNLICKTINVIKRCCVKCNENLAGNHIALNSSNRAALIETEDIFVQKIFKVEFNKVNIQQVEHISGGFITISQKNKDWIEKHGVNQFELKNEITCASIDININKIKYSEFDENSIKLNYFHRLILECDLPQKISSHHYEKYKIMLEKKENHLELLNKYFENEKALTGEVIKSEKDAYNHKKNIKKVLSECGYPKLALYPIEVENDNRNLFINRLVESILDIIIGSNKTQLKCIRPYETDESSNVVRLSKSTLDLLGIDETDNLIISYRGKCVKARALVIGEIESIKETNILQSESELNVCIGIPAHIRREIGISVINVCCNVERDKSYLFKKNLNIQFISILATVLAVKQTFNNNKIVFILLLLLLPCSIYMILSSVRNRIRNT